MNKKELLETILEDKYLKHLTKKDAEIFYNVHKGSHFFERLTKFMASGPCVILYLEGKDVIDRWRTMMGATKYEKAQKGTLRRDYGSPDVPVHENLVHGSDSPDSARYELNICMFDFEVNEF